MGSLSTNMHNYFSGKALKSKISLSALRNNKTKYFPTLLGKTDHSVILFEQHSFEQGHSDDWWSRQLSQIRENHSILIGEDIKGALDDDDDDGVDNNVGNAVDIDNNVVGKVVDDVVIVKTADGLKNEENKKVLLRRRNALEASVHTEFKL